MNCNTGNCPLKSGPDSCGYYRGGNCYHTRLAEGSAVVPAEDPTPM